MPGERISGIKLGMPIEQTIKNLGEGYLRGQLADGVDGYVWPSRGVRVGSTVGTVISVGAIPGDFAHAGLRYLTAEGLGLGSSAAEVKTIFGEPAKRGQVTAGEWWSYDSRRIVFGFDSQSRVYLLDIFLDPSDKKR